MGYAHIEIKSDKAPSIFTKIFIDGHELKGVRSFNLKCGAGNQIPILTLDLNAIDITIDGKVMKYRQEGMADFDIVWKTESESPYTDGSEIR